MNVLPTASEMLAANPGNLVESYGHLMVVIGPDETGEPKAGLVTADFTILATVKASGSTVQHTDAISGEDRPFVDRFIAR